jgi:hypothetical protein
MADYESPPLAENHHPWCSSATKAAIRASCRATLPNLTC